MKQCSKAVEVCPHCDSENIYPMWDVMTQGFVAVCQHCGEEIMLCDECMRCADELNNAWGGHCDWRKTESGGKCFRGITRERS